MKGRNRLRISANAFICTALISLSLMCTFSSDVGSLPQGSPLGKTRGLADTVGYAHTPVQIEAVMRMSDSLNSTYVTETLRGYGLDREIRWIAGICPHDDYIYAGTVYYDIMRNVTARHVILFGVAHRARDYGLQDRLIFDSFERWRGPYGPVSVSPLREAILERLPASDYTVDDAIQSVEHSVEGLIPFLQYSNRDVQIVSILVPYMNWATIDRLSRNLAEALESIISENDLALGRDIAFLCSNDCVHYGDQGWGGKDYAPFGADVDGYEQAVRRDDSLIEQYLVGQLETEKLHTFFSHLVDEEDVMTYKITWCGRFSVPFGLTCVTYLVEALRRPPLRGYLLKYDTSVASGELPLRAVGLGTTAPSNLRHWVGYCAIGYR